MKLTKLAVFLSFGLGGIVNFTAPSFSATFDVYSFSREYQDGNISSLTGEFAGKDINNDGVISGNEVAQFQAFLSDGYSVNSAAEKIRINDFAYSLGSNHLAFDVQTRRPPVDFFPFDINNYFFVDFANLKDGFIVQGDMVFLGEDALSTGTVTPTGDTIEADIPESSNIVALAILGLSLLGKGKKPL